MLEAAHRARRTQWSNRAASHGGWLELAGLVLVFVLVIDGAGLSGACGQETLRWKFREGDVLRYTTEQTTTLSFKAMGKERKQKRAQSVTFTWSINGVSPDGVALITQRIERVTMKIEAPPFIPFAYDSSTPATDVPEPFEGEVQQSKAVLGTEFSFKMKASGEIESIKFPDATLKKLREALPQEGGEREEFSEQRLKDLVTQQSPPAFPEGSLEPGKSWASKPTRIVLRLGTLVLDRSFTFQGPDPKDPNLMHITMEGRVSLEPRSDVTAKIRAQEGKGTLVFDKQSGRLVSSRGTQKTEMLFVAQGQEGDQTTDSTSVMTLIP
jgi:Family of unknown function (DUF6263)